MLKNSSGKFYSKAMEGCWLGYSGVSKGHCIYGANQEITVERNITFENILLKVPSPILISWEDKNDSIIESSNQNTMIQNVSKKSSQQPNQLPHDPSADIILHDLSERQGRDAGGTIMDSIVKDLEKTSLRHSERLNPP